MQVYAGPGGATKRCYKIKLVMKTDGVVAFISGGSAKIKGTFIISK